MRYVMKQKLFSIGGDSMITDARGNNRYLVDGAAISLGRRLVIKDVQNGQELATLQQALIALTPTFEIRTRSGASAKISVKILTITDRLKIDVPGWDDLEARGDLFRHEYGIYRKGREVAHVSKSWLSFRDAYGIDIDDGQDEGLILASAVVIDEILDMREKND